MHDEILKDLTEAREFIKAARSIQEDLDAATIVDAAHWIDLMILEFRANRERADECGRALTETAIDPNA